MYTQNIGLSNGKSQVVTFPNRDSIIQMQSLKAKSEQPQKTAPIKTSKKSSSGTDSLFLLSLLMGISENQAIGADLFSLVAGILLAL